MSKLKKAIDKKDLIELQNLLDTGENFEDVIIARCDSVKECLEICGLNSLFYAVKTQNWGCG